MRIERLTVRNFRNLVDVDLPLLPGAVIVGENRSGKSNLLHALRLILDANMSFNDRQLIRGDFWDGLSEGQADTYDPMAAGEVIEASIELGDFEDDVSLRAVLASALLEESPMRAKLTYRFAPVDTGDEARAGKPKYLGAVYGGDHFTKTIPSELRRFLHFLFLHALRDVESDIRSWRRSPLKALLESAAAAASDEDLDRVRDAMREANTQLNDLKVVKDLGENIGQQLVDMVGSNQAVSTELAVAPDDPLRLIRDMRLFVDGDAHRHLASASLGTLNVLYLALQEMGLEARELNQSDIAHVVMAIEEPEAHLHPHLQRLVFRRLLRNSRDRYTTMVTTQSPHIASVADPRSLVVLRPDGNRTEVAAAHLAPLADHEWDDVARYLDATRAELVFARRVLLVEGFAEQALLPKLAEAHGMDLDKLGISVCAIHGTHFGVYVRLCEALSIPWAVVTDGDTDKSEPRRGQARAAALLNLLGVTGTAVEHGIFVGSSTFEYDILTADQRNIPLSYAVLRELASERSATAITGWGSAPADYDAFMSMVDTVGGKGRYAQRLSQQPIQPPAYVAAALNYLERQ